MKQGWEIKKLGDIAYIGLGFTHTPEYVEKGVAFLSVKDISSGKICWDNIKYVSQQEYDSAPRGAKPSKGDIMFCRVGTMGKPVIIDTDLPFCTFVSLGYLHLLETDIINTYVKYWMQSNSFEIQVEANVKGIAIKNLNTGWLKTFDIPIPPREEQERIVAELDCLSGVIERKREQLRELDALAQSIFYQMFGDPITNEKRWDVKKIKDVAPQQEYKGNVPCIDGKYWLLNLDMVIPNTGEIIEKCYFDYEEIGNSTIIFNTDNVLYSKLRPYLNKVVIPNDIGYGTSELVPLKPHKDLLNKVFFASLLRSQYFVMYISGKVAGAKMPRVAMGEFREFAVILPPLTLQQEFADKIEAIEKQKALIKQSISKTEELFTARMDYYFN